MSNPTEKYSQRGIRNSNISTVIGISLVLFMIGIVLGGVLGLQDIQKQAKESLHGDVFFQPSLNESDIKSIEAKLKSWPEFKSIFYVSPDAAIDIFEGQSENEAEIKEIFDDQNPLPASLSYSPKESYATKEGMGKIKDKLLISFPDEISEVNYDPSSVETVNLGFKRFIFLILAIALILIVIAVAMINNTIRLSLYSKRFTIKTMQFVGAKGSFIRRPFLYQAFLQGIVSAIFGISLLLTLFYIIQNYFEILEISYSLQMFAILCAALIFLGVFITFISTWFALNKYLKMKLDDLY